VALVVFHTRRVREALRKPGKFGVDLLLLVGIGALLGAVLSYTQQVSKTYTPTVYISLSLWALPKYTLFSLSRGFAAYALSLLFTLVYGTIAAHNHRAEKIMVPALDVLQAIPVLGFLPGVVLAMIALFPTRQIGLEIACVVMIFTAQVWNMTFSFHGSLRGIPSALREAAAVNRLSGWQVFKLLEVPASMIGLVWNSMMSMAGGWFFLTIEEAFTLGDRDFRLPGVGSYMQQAINEFDPHVAATYRPILGAIVAMILMIVAVDQLFWRPIVVWAQRFKLEDTSDADKPQSWALNLLYRSFLFNWIGTVWAAHKKRQAAKRKPMPVMPVESTGALNYAPATREKRFAVINWIIVCLLALGAAWGAWKLLQLLIRLPFHDSTTHQDWIHVAAALLASFARVSAAVIIGAAWALPVGILIGLSPKWSQRLQPVIQVTASFPAPMLFPLVTLAIVAWHIKFTLGCVALMLLGAQWYILFNVIAGATAIPADLKEAANVYRMTRWEKWTRLYIPCVFPYLVTGLITAAGGAWNATIVSEYVQVRQDTFVAFGLGSIISQATASANFPLLTASVVLMAVFVVIVNRIFWKRLYRLAEDRYSLNT
jgi:NitT/TauT family transport system permease protein